MVVLRSLRLWCLCPSNRLERRCKLWAIWCNLELRSRSWSLEIWLAVELTLIVLSCKIWSFLRVILLLEWLHVLWLERLSRRCLVHGSLRTCCTATILNKRRWLCQTTWCNHYSKAGVVNSRIAHSVFCRLISYCRSSKSITSIQLRDTDLLFVVFRNVWLVLLILVIVLTMLLILATFVFATFTFTLILIECNTTGHLCAMALSLLLKFGAFWRSFWLRALESRSIWTAKNFRNRGSAQSNRRRLALTLTLRLFLPLSVAFRFILPLLSIGIGLCSFLTFVGSFPSRLSTFLVASCCIWSFVRSTK